MYAERDGNGTLIAVHNLPQPGASEEIAANDAEVLALSLAGSKAAALTRIDAIAESLRLRLITPGDGQALVYKAKAEEAERFLASPPASPQASDWPFLASQRAVDGGTYAQAAQTIVDTRDQWIAVAASIETARLGGKRDVAEAETPQEVRTVVNAIAWPSLG